MKRVIAVLMMMLFLAMNGSLYTGEGSSEVKFISKGDAAYKKFDNKAAVGLYQKAFDANPKNYEDNSAWHVLGRWHRRLSTLSWIQKKFAHVFLGGVPKEASMDKAVECFKKAILLNPSHINHHLELAITYEKMGEKDLAIEEYRKVLQLPTGDADDEDNKNETEKRLKKIG